MPQQGKKRKKHSALYAPLSFVIVAAALVFAMSVFFRVSEIQVTGNSLYTSQEIVEAAGIEEGDNLFFINRSTACSRIYARLPYVERADISRSLPNNVVIRITESEAIAYVTAEDGLWAIDRNGKLLSRTDQEGARSLIRIDGLTPIAPAEGQIIAPGESESPKVDYLAQILGQIYALGMRSSITYIDMSNVASPSFDYLGRFTVKLGSQDDTAYKFQVLISAVEALEEGDSGTIDLSVDKRAHFSYN
ncbi:MAG: cell division protein FtsQ/DivIB [Oscillospiraceae bacterium]